MRDNGGPVYPQWKRVEEFLMSTNSDPINQSVEHSGISLRDYFAAAALQGMLVGRPFIGGCADEAYYHADAMLKARNE
ncbi:MAG: hypothetical protein HC945_04575 [Nitrosarchaeum sp.]|nr:hypothetical protein [Nitrosarchaeum sp.]